jgi:hypothetical protein
LYDQLKVGPDNALYIEYDGTFPVEFPDFKNPTIEKLETTTSLDNEYEGTVTIPAAMEKAPLIPEERVTYEVSRPDLVEGNEGLAITPKKVGFNSFTIKVGFELPGIDFNSYGDDAKLTVQMTFPDHFLLKNQAENRIIKKSAFIRNITAGSYCSLGEIEVESYTFEEGESELTYSVVLEGGNSPITLTGNNPSFIFILDGGILDASYLMCSLYGKKEISGRENGFSDLQDAFGENDILKFKNPSLSFNLTTNLAASFGLNVNLWKDDISASLKAPLTFDNPTGDTKTQSYRLTPENLEKFDEIISTPLPEELAYTIGLVFNNQEAKLFPPDQLTLSADYSFNVPFDFKEINLSLKDTIAGLFDEDTYEQVFSHTKESVSIEADLVDISIGNGGIKLNISAAILDSNFREIINLGSVLKDNNTLSIAIKGGDLEKMKNARHLEFIFRLSGEGAITKDDYIKIDGVRLVSGSGIHYEF